MTRIERLEQEVRELSRAELGAFREWFREYDSDEWDRQIEEELRAGKLSELAKRALASHKAGNTKEL